MVADPDGNLIEIEYAVGGVGRVVAARLFEGEELYSSISQIATAEDIRCAAVLVTGAFQSSDLVVGLKSVTPEIVNDMRAFTGPGEVLGVGTLYWTETEPKLHMHVSIGKGDEVIVGDPRTGADVFMLLEITIIELLGIDAKRLPDPAREGFNLLRIKPGGRR
jgi:predicted DNA-binding protein with PD1-like motif